MRIVELILSAVGFVLCLPLLLFAILAIRLNSPGAAIFRQTRVGRNQKPFILYKLRTMSTGTVQAGTHEVSASSVTSVGRFLRATKLDELPQLWNVLKGEMALVGPRPCLPVQTALIEEREKRGVFEILPGITGLAQVEGIDMSDPERLAEREGDYVGEKSLSLDLRIILATVTGKGNGDRIRKES